MLTLCKTGIHMTNLQVFFRSGQMVAHRHPDWIGCFRLECHWAILFHYANFDCVICVPRSSKKLIQMIQA